MFAILFMMLFIAAPTQTAENLPQAANNNICSRNKKNTACCLATMAGCALALTAFYAATNPPQRCDILVDQGYFSEFNPINMEGYAFDVEIRDCGECVYASAVCNDPIPGIKDSNQLMQYINMSAQPLCGDKARYRVRSNVLRKSDPFGRSSVGFRDFTDAMKTVAADCKSASNQGSKEKVRFPKTHKYKKNFR